MSHFSLSSFKRPLSATTSENETDPEQSQKAKHDNATVFDAAVGRITRDLSADPSSINPRLRPDEVLYRAEDAPTRYEENDHYFAHEDLPSDQALPSSDLLQALHAYISEFYGRSEELVTTKVWKSMDETALLALGILLEESAREILGETGDLAFVEGVTKGELTDVAGDSENRNRRGRWITDEDEYEHDGDEVADDEDDDEDHSATSSLPVSTYSSDVESEY